MHSRRGLERLINFTDAVVAIAITLLVLPLIDDLSQAARQGTRPTPFGFFGEHIPELFALVLSFAVVAVLWREHHRLFEHLVGYTAGLLALDVVWVFAIAVAPITTAVTATLTGSSADHADAARDAQAIGIYIGAMLLASTAQVGMVLVASRHPEIQSEDNPVTETTVVRTAVVAGLFLVALLAGVAFPEQVGYLGLLVQTLNGPVDAVIGRATGRRARLERARPSSPDGVTAPSRG